MRDSNGRLTFEFFYAVVAIFLGVAIAAVPEFETSEAVAYYVHDSGNKAAVSFLRSELPMLIACVALNFQLIAMDIAIFYEIRKRGNVGPKEISPPAPVKRSQEKA